MSTVPGLRSFRVCRAHTSPKRLASVAQPREGWVRVEVAAAVGALRRGRAAARQYSRVPRELSQHVRRAPIHADLVDAGELVGRDRVARLIRSAGLEGVSPRKWTLTT